MAHTMVRIAEGRVGISPRGRPDALNLVNHRTKIAIVRITRGGDCRPARIIPRERKIVAPAVICRYAQFLCGRLLLLLLLGRDGDAAAAFFRGKYFRVFFRRNDACLNGFSLAWGQHIVVRDRFEALFFGDVAARFGIFVREKFYRRTFLFLFNVRVFKQCLDDFILVGLCFFGVAENEPPEVELEVQRQQNAEREQRREKPRKRGVRNPLRPGRIFRVF